MKFDLFVGLTFFCSLWTAGSFLQCLMCSSTDSYEDCQTKLKVQNCTADRACFQAEVKYEKDSKKEQAFSKGCLAKSFCEDYEKGEIGDCLTRKGQGYTVDCKGKCCHEDECNKENLLSKGSAFIISVLVLMSGLFLTLMNIN